MNDIIFASDKCQENKEDGYDRGMVVGDGVVVLTEVMEGLFDVPSLMNPPLRVNH